MDGDVEVRDILGAELRYCRARRWMRWSMRRAIEKAISKYLDPNARTCQRPCEPGLNVFEGEAHETYPLRELVGVLLFISTMGRPDISY